MYNIVIWPGQLGGGGGAQQHSLLHARGFHRHQYPHQHHQWHHPDHQTIVLIMINMKRCLSLLIK